MAGDTWVVGDRYDRYVGRWSRPVAAELLAWLDVPPGQRWLDVGCGTGALSGTVVAAAPVLVVGADTSAGFVAQARRAVPSASFAVADATRLPFEHDAFDVAVSGLVLNFVPEPGRMVAEMVRVVRSGGVVAVYVWDYAGEMQLMRRFWDAAVSLDPASAERDEGARFPLCRPDRLAALLEEAGLQEVESRAIDVPTGFRDLDDFWSPFLGGQGPAPAYVMSLTDEQREQLHDRLRDTLPTSEDGSIHLNARAWAVQGQV